MVVANRADAIAKGWTPSMGTFGVRSEDGSGGGGGGGSDPAQSAAGMGSLGQQIGQQITAAMTPFSQATSGVTAAQLAEQKRQFDATLEWQKQMWANQGMPQLEIQQRAQALAEKAQADQQAIAQGNLALSQKQQAAQESQFGQTFGLQQQQEAFNEAMGRSNLGLDYLKTAASMGGPADVFQSDDFIRGAQSAGAPAFLTALRNNTALPAFGATSGAAPTPLTADSLTGRMMNGAGPDSHAAALNSIGGIAQAGGAALSPQAIESLNPDEIAAMTSGFNKLGYSMPAFLQQYQQSRIGQGAAQAA